MVSIWNGLGGWRGDVLYQAGVDAICAAGNDVPQYDAFYEVVHPDVGWGTDIVPHTVITPLALYTLQPGDVITSRVHLSGGAVQFSLTDTRPATRATRSTGATGSTVRWRAAASTPVAAAGGAPSSAECIVERPTLTDSAGRTSLAALADFHTVFGSPADSCTVTDSTGRSAAVDAPTSRRARTTVVMTRDSAGGPLLTATHTPSTRSGHLPTVFWNRSS